MPRLNSNSRCQIGMDMNIAAVRSSRSLPNNSNPNQIRDDQGYLITSYKTRHEEEKRSYLQFIKDDIYNSSPSPVTKIYSKRKRNPINFLMNNHPSNNNKRAAVKLPRNIEVVRQYDESVSIMTS